MKNRILFICLISISFCFLGAKGETTAQTDTQKLTDRVTQIEKNQTELYSALNEKYAAKSEALADRSLRLGSSVITFISIIIGLMVALNIITYIPYSQKLSKLGKEIKDLDARKNEYTKGLIELKELTNEANEQRVKYMELKTELDTVRNYTQASLKERNERANDIRTKLENIENSFYKQGTISEETKTMLDEYYKFSNFLQSLGNELTISDYRLRTAYFSVNDQADKAFLEIEEWKKIDSSIEPILYSGYVYSENNNHEEAIKCYDEFLKEEPEFHVAWNKKGYADFNLQQFDKALESFKKAFDLNPIDFNLCLNIGNTYIKLKQADRAIEFYDEAIKINPSYYQAWLNKGVAFTILKLDDKAYECFEKEIEIMPGSYEDWNNVGSAFAIIKRYERALFCYEQSKEINPTNFLTWNYSGNIYTDMEKYEQAIDNYSESLRINPDNADTLVYEGNAYAKLHKYEEAIKRYNEALKLQPDMWEAMINNGNAYCNLHRYIKAIEFYDSGLKLKPDLAAVWCDKGFSLHKLGQLEEANECYDKALELDQINHGALFNKACLSSLKQNKENMLELLNKAIALYSEYNAQAREDEDFKEYWADPDFIKLTS